MKLLEQIAQNISFVAVCAAIIAGLALLARIAER